LATLRIFGFSLAVTVVSLAVAYLYGGPTALFLVIVLSILEVSLSLDNAVLNATILQRMSLFWQRIFLTVGILIAVFGMRMTFPLLIVWATARLDPVEALRLALNPPANGALELPDGSPSYLKLITAAHPQIAAFGGTFLLMLFLDFVFVDRDIKWLRWLEVPLARIGRLDQLSVVVSSGALIVTATLLTDTADALATVMIAGVLGILTYLVINGLGGLFHPPEHNGPSELAKAAGRAGFFLFLYLEVLDATFSFDGVISAFAITADPIIIALGLGLVARCSSVDHHLPGAKGHVASLRLSRARCALGDRHAGGDPAGVGRLPRPRSGHRSGRCGARRGGLRLQRDPVSSALRNRRVDEPGAAFVSS
jgi:uncharacterized protein